MCLRGEKQESSDKHPAPEGAHASLPKFSLCPTLYATKIPDGILPPLNKEHRSTMLQAKPTVCLSSCLFSAPALCEAAKGKLAKKTSLVCDTR